MTDWLDEGRAGSAVDVPALLDSNVPALLARIVSAGALVSLGTTSDGGALGVTVTVDGRWRRDYFRDTEELVNWLEQGAEFCEASAERPLASSGRRRRSRGVRAP